MKENFIYLKLKMMASPFCVISCLHSWRLELSGQKLCVGKSEACRLAEVLREILK